MTATDPDFRSADTPVTDVINDVISHGGKSVTTTAAELYAGTGGRQAGRKQLWITPTNGTIYVGAAGVTAATGTPVFANQTMVINVSDVNAAAVYGISAGATINVRILEAG